ncbi:MAG: cyclic lactone autoinducer peptide [Lachnospiraceae bacterium]|nr:cyclic lactone autoinducer peptide [Lachnospiraceae bacterium]
MKKGKEKMLKIIADMAYVTSKKEVDSVCKWLYYQPELPKEVQKLKYDKD